MTAYSYLTLQSGWDSLEDNPFMLAKITSYILEKKYLSPASLALTYGQPKNAK